ncbi:MAG: hypothetical protein QXS85_04925 [Acidilobaceae archaeon]
MLLSEAGTVVASLALKDFKAGIGLEGRAVKRRASRRATSLAAIAIIAAIIALVIALVILPIAIALAGAAKALYYALSVWHCVDAWSCEIIPEDESSRELLERTGVPVYYVGELPSYHRIIFNRVGLAPRPLDLEAEALERALVVAHVDEVLENASEYSRLFSRLVDSCRGCAIALLNGFPRRADITPHVLVLEALENAGVYPPVPLDPNQPIEREERGELKKPRLHPAVLTADMVVYSIDPPGVIVVESLTSHNSKRVLRAVLEWTRLLEESKTISRTGVSHFSVDFSPREPSLIGYIGWIRSHVTVCSKVKGSANECPSTVCDKVKGPVYIYDNCLIGIQFVYSEYYFSGYQVGALSHPAWFVYTKHAAIGYSVRCCTLSGHICKIVHHYPRLFETSTHWLSDQTGQILRDWGPKNVAGGRTIFYQVYAGTLPGVGVSITATVTYGVGVVEPHGPYYIAGDRGRAWLGLARAEHWVERGGYSEDRMSGRLFAVGSGSFGFISSIGREVGLVEHSFDIKLNRGEEYCTILEGRKAIVMTKRDPIRFFVELWPDRAMPGRGLAERLSG